jgi:hypothetical protein
MALKRRVKMVILPNFLLAHASNSDQILIDFFPQGGLKMIIFCVFYDGPVNVCGDFWMTRIGSSETLVFGFFCNRTKCFQSAFTSSQTTQNTSDITSNDTTNNTSE